MSGLGNKRAAEGRLDRDELETGAVPPSTADEGSKTASSSSALAVTLAKAGPRPEDAPCKNPLKGLATSSARAAPSAGFRAFNFGANSAAAVPTAAAAALAPSSSSPSSTGAFDFGAEFDFSAGVKVLAAAQTASATEKNPDPDGEDIDPDEAEAPAPIASATTQPNARSPRATPTEAIGNNATGFDLFDLNAYPPYTKELDAYVQERLSSLGPVWSKTAQKNFRAFALTWENDTEGAVDANQDWSTCGKESMMKTIDFVFRLNPASIEQRAEEFLGKMLNNNKYPPRMKLVGREDAMSDLASFCVSHLGKAKSGKYLEHHPKPLEQEETDASSEKEITSSSIIYAPGTPDKPGLMTLFSTRGSGKTLPEKRRKT